MNSDTALRQEIRHRLEGARHRIRRYTGLYPNEDLIKEVLRVCDEATGWSGYDPRLDEARRTIGERCRRLAEVADRFADRDPAVIATARAQAIAAVDLFQDSVLRLRKASLPNPHPFGLLRQRSL